MPPWGATRRRYGTGSVLPAAAAGACESSGGIRVAGGRSLCVPRRHHYRCPRDSPGTVRVVSFLERATRGIHLNPGKMVALAPKGHVPTTKEISLLAGVGVRIIADEGEIKVVGVPVGTDEFAIESAVGIVRDLGGGAFARMLPRMPDKQATKLIATGSMVQRTAYVKRVMGPKLSPTGCR